MGQRTRSSLDAYFAAQFPDNTSKAITPQSLRDFLNDLVDSDWNILDDGVPSGSSGSSGIIQMSNGAGGFSSTTIDGTGGNLTATGNNMTITGGTIGNGLFLTTASGGAIEIQPTDGDLQLATTSNFGITIAPNGSGKIALAGETQFGLAKKIGVVEGTGGRVGQVALTSGTKAITISGLTTSSRAFVQLVSPSGATLTVNYQAVCTSNTLTIQANLAATTINTSDGSTLNYFVIN